MKSYELSTVQKNLCSQLSEAAVAVCKLENLKARRCKPEHFQTLVYRYYGRVPAMTRELEKCIKWVGEKGKKFFTPMRFYNWCERRVKWAKDEELRQQEKKKLMSGTTYQRIDYQRRFKKPVENYSL